MSCRAQPSVTFIHWLHLAKLNPVFRIGVIAQMVKRRNDDQECWFEPAVRHYISSNNDCLLAYMYVFTGGDPQLELLKRNESKRVYWFQARFLSLVYL